MLQWTGGSRRKVATSRKSTHSRQKQYFEQRKRQRQAPGLGKHANGSDVEVLYNAQPRSLDILNLINLAVASEQASSDLTISANYDVAEASDDSLLGKVTETYSTVSEGERLVQATTSSDSDLPKVCQTNTYGCAGHVNKLKVQGCVPEHTSSCLVDKSNEKNEKRQFEATVLDLLDDESSSNGRSIPEAHVALLVEGLGKIGSQTPAHSPRMQNRFSCKGIHIASKLAKRVHSSSALEFSHGDLVGELNAVCDDFRLSPLCSNGDPWAHIGINTAIHKSDVAPLPSYSLADRIEKISVKRKGFDACLLATKEKHQYGSPPHFGRPTLEEINPSVIWDSVGVNADEVFSAPAWNFLPAEDSQDSIRLLSENSSSSSAVRNRTYPSFGTRSVKPGKGRTDSDEKIQWFSEGKSFTSFRSQDENMSTGFDDTIWGENQTCAENTFFPCQTFPSREDSSLDPFNSFTIRKSSTCSGYKAMNQDDHFDLFHTPKSKFEIPSGCDHPDFIHHHERLSKQSVLDLNSYVPINPLSKAKGHGEYSSSGRDLCGEMHSTHLPKYQEYTEDRGSSGKPQPKDAEKKPASSGNAESAAGTESKNEIPEPCCSPRVEKSDEAEVIPNLMEEFPSQIQNYVRSKLNQFQGRSPEFSHPGNEDSKATFEPKSNRFQGEGGGDGDPSYQVMLQSYVLQLLCVQKVLLEASGKDVKKKV